MNSRLASAAAFAVVGALGLWGCGGGGGGNPNPAGPSGGGGNPPTPQTVTVNIGGSTGNTAFKPNPVSANTGDTVMFKNGDSTAHHIVLDDGSADLGEIGPGATSRGFTVRNGSVAATYHCLLHSSMVGAVNGNTAPDPPPCNDPYGYGC